MFMIMSDEEGGWTITSVGICRGADAVVMHNEVLMYGGMMSRRLP